MRSWPRWDAALFRSRTVQTDVEFEREIGALVECGYAERCGDMVKWTDKIAPVMRAETRWADPSPPITLSHDVLERVNRLVQDRNPISAMALVRAETGASTPRVQDVCGRPRAEKPTERIRAPAFRYPPKSGITVTVHSIRHRHSWRS